MSRSRIAGPLAALLALFAFPAVASAHRLPGPYQSPLPLAFYLSGAAFVVAASFAIVVVGNRISPPPRADDVRVVPAGVRLGLRCLGLVAWLWIAIQALLGDGGSDADVASLFLWVYGWVGLALVSALAFPVWRWVDPFVTLHDLGAALLERLGIEGWYAAPYPVRLGQWPAVVGFVFFVWIELVAVFALGGRAAAVVMVTYTVVSLLFMAQYGKDSWRSNGETFSLWFGTLGRLAPFAVAEGRDDAVVRRSFASGLLDTDWSAARLTLIAVGTGAIIYDGLSQTTLFFDALGTPGFLQGTLLLACFLGGLCLVVFAVARVAGRVAVGAGLVPIAVGYLIAHYLTVLLGDGQRIVAVISDPLVQGWDLFGTAFFEPATDWIPPSLLWTVVLVAVVGGHMLGAWSGHAATARTSRSAIGLRQVPLAMLMVALTVTTLWSLGQTAVREEAAPSAVLGREAGGP